jgi:HTH-type transcriptional regulator/antitoxin HipB
MPTESFIATVFASHGVQIRTFKPKMLAMTDIARLPDELGHQIRAHREALGMSKSQLADKAGKVREVIYRLEAGEEATVSSLLAVLGAMGLALRLERAGLPSAQDVARRFQADDENEDADDAS